MRAAGWIRAYPLVAATVVVGALGVGLALGGAGRAVAILVGGYALAMAAKEAYEMVRALARGQFGLDVLAVVAIVATVAVGDHWAALIVVLMLTGGQALEDHANSRAQREMSALLERAPSTARRVDAAGVESEVDVADLVPGDLVLVRPGEVVPVDGTLEGDPTSFDESSITGEPLPVDRVPGERVLSGALATQRVALVRAEATAADSQYSQIVALVRQAAASKAPIVRLADRYALPFTLVALAIAGLGWWASGDAVRFAQVLVVATPCPLLIAAPVAFLAGMGRAAGAGMIFKSGGVMETLSRVATMAFDKTGTLTMGRPEVSSVEPADGVSREELLGLAASVERYSTHVLARAIVRAASKEQVAVPDAVDVEERTAAGMLALVAGERLSVGNARHVEAVSGVRAPDAALAPGRIAIHVAVDGRHLGRLLLTDRIRPSAATTLRALEAMGVHRLAILTGDAPATSRLIGDQLGVSDVRAGLLPAEKVAQMADMAHRPVAMVGDGVNDAPVLAAADVGVAMGAKGATAASESADVVVMVDDLSRVAAAVAISRRTVTVALQAIWLGIAISVALMLVAVWGVIPATVGAAAQELVDLAAIGVALRAVKPGRSELALEARIGARRHARPDLARV